jgi:hypothetical protein
MELFTERHAAKITGELSCLDRVVISGTLPGICYADGMSRYLRFNGIRIFDYARLRCLIEFDWVTRQFYTFHRNSYAALVSETF